MLSKEQMFTDADLSPRPHQAFPLVGLALQLPREQNLNACLKKIARRGIAGTERLRPRSAAASIKARWKHASVVEDHQVARVQQLRKVAELPIIPAAGVRLPRRTVNVQQSRARSVGQRLLRNQFIRKLVIEIGD